MQLRLGQHLRARNTSYTRGQLAMIQYVLSKARSLPVSQNKVVGDAMFTAL